ncbi:MAG TPA: MoxR family ATPase [Candidatus Ozemobacteraceae bacterium]|nr:MoxR family ATPase [Candidatus Ozemobacteraceae bacterium]
MNSIHDMIKRLETILLGKPDVIEMAMTCLLAGGHLLLEDLPGVGKTTLAAALARLVQGKFNRVQFTADLLPSDIIGTRIYRRRDDTFEFIRGPIFSHFLLADELNRAPPKTQSALLQAMNERAVSVDCETIPLPEPFMVIATQNPRGYHGTYPLPESQRDRFLMRLSIGFPDLDTEMRILAGHREKEPVDSLQSVLTPEETVAMQAKIKGVRVPEPVAAYISRLAEATRAHPDVLVPVSPRGSIALMKATQALAFIRDREFIDIDLVKYLAPAVLGHRMSLRIASQIAGGEGAPVSWVDRELLQCVPVE